MSIDCDIIVSRSATPEQLTALGAALWRWSNRTRGPRGIYQSLDSQVMADLIAGKLPSPNQTPAQFDQESDGIHFRMRDDESPDLDHALADLRREIPASGVVDVTASGISWNQDPTDVLPSIVM